MEPYLSVVVATRDDNHGGNPQARLKAVLGVYKKQAEALKFPIEYIIVDWNSPKEKAGIYPQVKSWGLKSEYLKIRVIKVSEAIHRKMDEAKIPFYQMIAKNVGIRRAKGKFVLASNIDIFLDDELMKLISKRSLKENRMYRSDRWDLDYKFLRRITLKGGYNIPEKWITRKHIRDKSILKNDLAMFAKHQNLSIPAFTSRVPPGRWLKEKVRIWKKSFSLYGSPGFNLHTNGCGDFTMLSQKAWHALRGYPEFKVFSFHIDSILCHQAHEFGFSEFVFPDPLVHYHIDHSDGWTPETNDELFKRLRKSQVPFIENQFDTLTQACRKTKKPLFNFSSWGLIGDLLPESSV
jgi:hypothetical protein